MARAIGANARLALAFEATEGVSPLTGYRRYSFTSSTLGEEAPLIGGELMGQGREPGEPTRDASTAEGDVVVPICARQFPTWLRALFDVPTSAAGKPARGRISFTANPANNATITIGTQAFTFTTSTPTSNQIAIGATLAATLTNAVRALNASDVSGVSGATYRLNDRANAIEIEHDTLGTSGNSLALAAGTSPASNATVSASTLAGGAASGGYRHIFKSGTAVLPSLSLELSNPEVPSYRMNFGAKLGSLAIQTQRGGNLTANLGMVAQGEDKLSATLISDSVADELPLVRLSQSSATVRRDGVPIADLTGAQFTFNNGLDAVPGIRSDGRVTGIDAGEFTASVALNVRFSSAELLDLAENGTPVEIEIVWTHPGTGYSVRIIVHRVILPKAKLPLSGPGGIQADYNCVAAKDPVLGRSVTVVVDNDQAGSVYGAS